VETGRSIGISLFTQRDHNTNGRFGRVTHHTRQRRDDAGHSNITRLSWPSEPRENRSSARADRVARSVIPSFWVGWSITNLDHSGCTIADWSRRPSRPSLTITPRHGPIGTSGSSGGMMHGVKAVCGAIWGERLGLDRVGDRLRRRGTVGQHRQMRIGETGTHQLCWQ